jgi:hypothetical protein
MYAVDVDFDVYKALMARRTTEAVSFNDAIRELLKLPPTPRGSPAPAGTPASALSGGDWVVKGIRFRAGTQFRTKYKGEEYLARVEDGALVYNGERFDSPSSAGFAVTRNPINGWTFWEYREPDGTWRLMDYRRKAK